MHFIGIDIGTSSICGIIFDADSGKIESLTKENRTLTEGVESWEKIQHPADIMRTVESIITVFLSTCSDIGGIGITGQMHGILYVDCEGNAVSPLLTWEDGRGNHPYDKDQTYSGYLKERSGYDLASGYGLVTHFYNLKNNLVPREADRLCTIMDYAGMKLTGRKSPLTDFTNGASLGFFDLKNLCFDTSCLKRLGIDPRILPETAGSATFSGLYGGSIPVYSAIGDNQASYIGSVSDPDNSVLVTVGTGSQISVFTPEYIKIETLDTRPFPGGGYLIAGAALCGGRAFEILQLFFSQTLTYFTGSSPEKESLYRKMTSLEYPAGSGDIPLVDTLLAGKRSDPLLRGRITNISTSNLTPGNLVIAFLRGISNELFDFYGMIPASVRDRKSILVGSGNAIRKNKLLREAFEERFNKKLIVPAHAEEAAYGASLCAVVGSGHAATFHEACQLINNKY